MSNQIPMGQTLLIPLPPIESHVGELYLEHIQHLIPFKDIVGLVIFLNYFASEEDREAIKGGYIEQLTRSVYFNTQKMVRGNEWGLSLLASLDKTLSDITDYYSTQIYINDALNNFASIYQTFQPSFTMQGLDAIRISLIEPVF